MCQLCVSKIEDFGEILPGWWLVRATVNGNMMKTNDWGLVECNDPTFVFSTTPVKDPIENSDILNRFLSFKAVCDTIQKEMQESLVVRKYNDELRSWGKLYEAIKLAGYISEDGNPTIWLCNHMAIYIEEHPTPKSHGL